MNTKQEFMRIMNEQTEIALATCVDGQPNVRVVNFYFDTVNHCLLFTTLSSNEKVREFEENDKVAFTTIPHSGNEHVKGKGLVRKSDRTISEVAKFFTNKLPEYQKTIERAGDERILYEVVFYSTIVTLDFERISTYSSAKRS